MANEKRLIDANALRNEIAEENPYIHFGPFGYCACSPKTDGELVFKREDVLRAIDSAPTVDAVEVVHGEWSTIEDDYVGLVALQCSKCNEEYWFEEEPPTKSYNYCPNCGAKMDKNENP